MKIYLLRHGETTYNEKGCYYGVTDPPLNEKGARQAEDLHRYFTGKVFDYIVASPLERAARTAEIVTGRSRDIMTLDARLMEQDFGIFEGHTYEELQCSHPEEMAAWNRSFQEYRIPGGESFRDVRERMDAFVADLPTEMGTMLLVAHKGTLGHLIASLLHMPLDGYWNFVFDQGCYSCVDIEDGYAIVRTLNQSIYVRTGEKHGFV